MPNTNAARGAHNRWRIDQEFDGRLAAAKMEFINTRTSARPYRQLEEEYTLTFMSAMPDGAATPERKLSDRGTEFAAHSDSLAYRAIHLRLPAHGHVFARSRKSDRARSSICARR
jgi:hypothetical protein